MSDRGVRQENPTAADFYCGAGGASWGMTEAGFNVVAALDNDPTRLEAHEETFGHNEILHDVTDADTGILPGDALGADLWHFSPSCQPYSSSNGEPAEGDERVDTLRVIPEWVAAGRPKAVTIENVPNLQYESGPWNDLRGGLRDAGYELRWRVLNAADYGVPQTRRRLFVVAIRDDPDVPSRWFPRSTHSEHGTTTLDGRQLGSWVSAGEALGVEATKNHGVTSSSRWRQSGEPAGTVGASSEMYAADGGDSVYDQPACTITSRGYLRERGHHESINDDDVRRLTPDELATLQSFDESHVFVGTDKQMRQQIGNAVPPRLMEHVAGHIRTEVL